MTPDAVQAQRVPETKADDRSMEAAVLGQVLDVQPTHLTLDELARELAGGEPSFSERDAADRAVRELAGVGLLHLQDGFVSPTRAALHFAELSER